MIDQLYPMRDENYTKGLLDLITYIQSYNDTSDMRMVEVGSYAGESTVIFSKFFKEVIAIDPYINNYDQNDIACSYKDFNQVYSIFLNNTKQFTNIKLIKNTSDDAVHEFKMDSLNFVYIDGMHTYYQVKNDIKNYIPLIKKGGFLAGHDYHHVWPGVIEAVHETVGKPDCTFQDTSWIIRV